MHMHSIDRLGLQPTTGERALEEQAKATFKQGERFYRAGNYTSAIVRFERVRQMPVVPKRENLLYNIGLANLKLKRFATAIIYFENYLESPGIPQANRAEAQERLNEAKRRAGIPVTS